MAGAAALAARLEPSVAAVYALAHPVSWLRWLRAAITLMILATGLLSLLVTYQAHREITLTTSNAAAAISSISNADVQLGESYRAVRATFDGGAVQLTGTGTGYREDFTGASQDLVIAAEDNVAGNPGSDQIQFAEGLAVIYDTLIQQADANYAEAGTGALGKADLNYAGQMLGNVQGELGKLHRQQVDAAKAAVASRWLGPGDIWWLLLAPVLALLLLTAVTTYVLWRGFRRVLSGRILAALALMLGLVVLVASLNVHDSGHAQALSRLLTFGFPTKTLSLPPAADAGLAYSLGVLAAGLACVIGASALAVASFRSRLSEYRYQS